MLNKFSDKNNKFSKYRDPTMLFYNHGDALAVHTVFFRYGLCYICLNGIRNTHAKHAKLSHVTC